jgi:hypothetical protein
MPPAVAEPIDRVLDGEEDYDERGVADGRFRAVGRSRSDQAHHDDGRDVPTPSRLSLEKGVQAVGTASCTTTASTSPTTRPANPLNSYPATGSASASSASMNASKGRSIERSLCVKSRAVPKALRTKTGFHRWLRCSSSRPARCA